MTTGLDPQARRDTWGLIEAVRDRGVTILLVTHYMDEAERLCDRVAPFDRGKIVAIDTPEGLADRAGVAKRVRFIPSAPFEDRLLGAPKQPGGFILSLLPSAQSLLVMAAYALLFGILAVRYFRWE